MGTIIFRRNTDVRFADAWAERTWKIPATGEAGSATIVLPYSSPAASSTYIDPEGGSYVEIASEGDCGKWRGIVTEIEYDTSTIRLSAAQPQMILGRRIMHFEGNVRHAVSLDAIVSKVLREALPGFPLLWCRYYPNGGNDPVIRNYGFSGQDAWSIILEMMDQGNSELFVDGETGEVTWRGGLAGNQYGGNLFSGSTLLNWRYRVSVMNRISEVTVKAGAHRHIVSDGGAAKSFPAQAIITSGAAASIGLSAELELLRSSTAQVAVEGSVPPSKWSLREGNTVRVVVSEGRFSGAEHPCRIIGRTLSDDSSLMGVELQVINENLGATTPPPARGGSATNSGALGRGSFSQRMSSSSRRSWMTYLLQN